MACGSGDLSKLDDAIMKGAGIIGHEELKCKQKEALRYFLKGKDVFVSLPTGYGKSLIYQSAPFSYDELNGTCNSLAVVISPLISLMKDQKESLQERQIAAVYLGEKDDDVPPRDLSTTKILISSPEMMLSDRGRQILNENRRRICGLFVDESHCVAMWGQADEGGKLTAFRESYGRLAELRAILPSAVPIIALTATATAEDRTTIIKSLGMSNLEFVTASPNRSNIRYSFVDLSKVDEEDSFKWLIQNLKDNGQSAERYIIFCATRKQCHTLYRLFEDHLGECGLFAMFHRTSEEGVKEDVLQSMSKADGKVRVLFATVAFGMGVDVKACHNVIHYYLPKNSACYFQESGRCGRDGEQSYAILIKHSGWRAGRAASTKEMVEYGTSTACRRQHLMQVFDFDVNCLEPKHLCCDNCAKACKCDGEPCNNGNKGKGDAEIALNTLNAQSKTKSPVRSVSPESMEAFRAELSRYRLSLLPPVEEGSSTGSFTGDDLSSGFPVELINMLVRDVCYIKDEDNLKQYPFFSEVHAVHVWSIFTDIIIANSTHDLGEAFAELDLADVENFDEETDAVASEQNSESDHSPSSESDGSIELESDLFDSSDDAPSASSESD